MPPLSPDAWAAKLENHGYCCAYCGSEDDKLIQEHVTPKRRGGSDAPENIVPACEPCNFKKGMMTGDEYRHFLATGQHLRFSETAVPNVLVSQADASRILGVSRARIGQLIEAGTLPYVERSVVERAVRLADVERLRATDRPRGRPRKHQSAQET